MSKKDLIHFNEQYYNKLLSYRDNLRIIQQQATINFQIIEDIYVLPVNLFRITQDYSNLNNDLKDNKQKYDLLPKHIEDSIELFLNDYDNRFILRSC